MNQNHLWRIKILGACVLSGFSYADSATLWTVDCQNPLSIGFSRQEYWSGFLCHPSGALPNPGMEPASPALQVDSLPLSQGSPRFWESPSHSLVSFCWSGLGPEYLCVWSYRCSLSSPDAGPSEVLECCPISQVIVYKALQHLEYVCWNPKEENGHEDWKLIYIRASLMVQWLRICPAT